MQVRKEFKNIKRHYKALIKITKKHCFVGITNEWLVDNYYLLLEKEGSIINFLMDYKVSKYATKNINMYDVMLKILEKNNYLIDEKKLMEELVSFQKNNNYNFLYEELFIIPVITSTLLIKKISETCTHESLILKNKKKIDNLILKLKKEVKLYSTTNLDKNYIINKKTTYDEIAYLNDQIRELGKYSNKLFKQFNDLLKENGLILRNVIYDVHLETASANITMSNLFISINNVNDIKTETLYDQVCVIEKILKKDKLYSNMTLETKNLYRQQLTQNSKKKKQTTYDYIVNLLKNNKEVSKSLFYKNKTSKLAWLYILSIIIITIILACFLAGLLTPYFWLGFILLLIPTSEIVITLLKRVILLFVKGSPLPKLDFSLGIPDEYKTIVVIPTIIKDGKKIRKVFENIESFYLSSKSKNLYFALLGDCMEYNQENYEKDSEIVESGLKIVEELNKKYGQNIFHFVYRKRQYNEGEGSWLGRERKRGALLDFNDLILGNLSEEQQKDYFSTHTFHNFNQKIKYVITLDVDTKLWLDSALSLVGVMAHPLNKPVLNKEKTCVISGYGLMQPKMSVDVASTNKSFFSQLYAGIGGFDPYNAIFPDFYQDVFGEGSFTGKGIYDLEVYQQILKNSFPDNLILSHDLLEGNYLRCANVSDIELIDDFPSKFLVDACRRSRWARGDFQIIGWLKKNVKNRSNKKINNPISLLGKWKILDNIRRELLEFSLLLLTVASFVIGKIHPLWWISFVLIVLFTPTIKHIREKLTFGNFSLFNLKYYNLIAFGDKALILRTLSVFSCIPYNAYLYLNSFCKSSYRMFISKKKLLNWITGEDAEKFVATTLKNNIKQFWPNYFIVGILIVEMIITKKYLITGIITSVIFIVGPIVAYLISRDIKEKGNSDFENEYLEELAKETWKFFADNLNEKNNYLIPDNYQINRDIKEDLKTSPTNIGMSLTSIVSAYELELINKEEAIDLIKKVVATLKVLPKWNGHLYNWYNIRTLEILLPGFISSVDSGNLIASLIVVKSFLNQMSPNDLMMDVDNLIKNTNFKVLLNDKNLLSVGYSVDEEHLLEYSYNRFMSESRIASYVAIAKGDVSSKHWFSLDKTLSSFRRVKGVVSWSGTSFEYFMPLIFMKSYNNTLLDESYYFAYYAQKKYMKEINKKYPWGISESAYNELDDAQNYKYKAFGVPYLCLRGEQSSRIVISPYSSVLAITKFPKDVINNIKKYDSLNMRGEYGLYEAYDITDKTQVLTYFSHHQGMILSSLTNYLKDDIIQKYFQEDVNNKPFIILTKEKVEMRPTINSSINKYKKYTYEKECFENDIRSFHHISTLPEISVLSNSKYSTIINDRGNGYSKYRTINLNRYRKVTEQNYGMFMYIKDLNTNYVWSNTYAPVNIKPEKYEVVFALDRIKFIRLDNDIVTTSEIVVTRKHHAEIRKVTFKNNSNKVKHLELTTYTEPIICENNDDIAHRAFNSLFVDSEYDEDTNSVIMSRKQKNSQLHYYIINRLLIEKPSGKFSYETSRTDFIGRNHNGTNPACLNQPLTNHVGTTLDPIISLRNQITIEKNSKVTVYYICGFGKSKEQVLNIVKTYSNEKAIKEQGFEVATIMNNVTNKMVNITGNDMRLYNTMLNYLLQTSHIYISDKRNNTLMKNTLNQSNLWRYGISGDYPIVLLDAKDSEDISLVKELLHAFEYYKSKSLFIDLVIINSENKEYAKVIASEIEAEKYHMQAINSFNKTPGNIYVLEKDIINEEELVLLNTVARLKIDSSIYPSLHDYIEALQKLNTVSRKDKVKNVQSEEIPYEESELKFFNTFGGFTNNGKEYLITNKETPLAWSNVMSSEKFGTIITNNNCGFTYALNSRDYKLTSWTNDNLLTDASEGIKINDINLNFDLTKFGFGYSEFKGLYKNIEINLIEFISNSELIKFYKLKIKNNSLDKKELNIKYWINPNLGETEEKTSRYLLCDFNEEQNYVKMRNVYNQNYGNVYTFMTSTNPIESVNINQILFKEITSSISLEVGEEKEIGFMLGASDNDNLDFNIKKYANIKAIDKELNIVKDSWKTKLEVIQVKTPDESFNYMVNGWLLYQTLSSRLYAKAGFYQISGSYGFRDQLQDSMNICNIHPEMTKKQILINASHQFVEGDVLHWWNEDTKFGLRSLYKDDYLWLIYATSEYTKITDDYAILNEQLPFINGPLLEKGESDRGFNFTYSDISNTLYEHCLLALEKAMQELGENGLPLMGGGDWNDGMNKVGINGLGTSVWLGFFLYQMVNNFIDLTKKYDSSLDVTKYIDFNLTLKKSLDDIAWDGEYYKRAFFDNNHELGSITNKECSIDLISQCFAILTGIADEKKTASIIENIEEKLVDKNLKIIKLLTPSFKNSEDNPGYIMDYPEGIRENGGQYTHATAWYIMALLKLGKKDKAFEYYQMINPINRTLTEKDVLKYKVEPYVIAADIYSNSDFAGQGGWTWYTGSSAWFYKVAITDILGFIKEGNKLFIKPNVPSTWENYYITYKYQDTTYEIEVVLNKDKFLIEQDGHILNDNFITLENDLLNHNVKFEIGGQND